MGQRGTHAGLISALPSSKVDGFCGLVQGKRYPALHARHQAQAGVIVDVYTSAGTEYLRVRDAAAVRPDRILALNGQPFGRHA